MYTNYSSDPTAFHLLVLAPQLLETRRAFEQASINRSSDCQCATNNGAEASQKAGKALLSLFSVHDFHWRNVLRIVSEEV
jgi:hypothetical protein